MASSEFDVNLIVETVLDRLERKNRARPASPSDNDSHEVEEFELVQDRTALAALKHTLRYDVLPPHDSVARRIEMTAFEGSKNANPVFSASHPEQLHAHLVASSIRHLPSRHAINMLVDVYLNEIEPGKNLFNRPILFHQIQEFWDDADELLKAEHLDDNPPNVPSEPNNTFMDAWVWQQETPASWIQDNNYRICSTFRQGLVALVFSLIEKAAHLLDLATLVDLQVLPPSAQEQDLHVWTSRMDTRSKFHLALSKCILCPTLWTLQVMLLIHPVTAARTSRDTGVNTFNVHFGTPGLALQIAVTLGLNRLGNGYEDAKGSRGREASGHSETTCKVRDPIHTQQHYVTSTMRNGTWIVDFEKGNIALRELGRKIWTSLTMMDNFISNHFNQHYYVHEDMDHTAPPAPVNDEDLLSPYAHVILAQSRPDSPIPSENTFCAYAATLSKVSRLQVQLENKKGAPLPYRDVLHLDASFKAHLEALPPFFRVDWTSETLAQERPVLKHKYGAGSIALQRAILNDQTFFRMLRLHRFYLGKGIKHTHFRRSTVACVEAARGILAARIELEKSGHNIRSAFFLQSHLMHAALVFQLILLHEMDRMRSSSHTFTSTSCSDPYKFQDFDITLKHLQKCLDFLKPDLGFKEFNEIVEQLANFSQHLHFQYNQHPCRLHGTKPVFTSNPPTTVSHTDAATILASMPARQKSEIPWQPSQSIDPALLSLEAFLPEYDADGVDLISVLESSLFHDNREKSAR